MPDPLPLARILRAKRRLDPFEVHALLRGLPADLDANQEWLADSSRLSARLAVRWLGAIDRPDSFLTLPLKEWPPVEVVFVAQPEADVEVDEWVTIRPAEFGARGTTRVGDSAASDPVVRFATLIYELLGGPVDSNGKLRIVPLPMLNETADGILRGAMSERRRYRDCQEFWRAWEGGLEPLQRATPTGMILWRSLPAAPPDSSEGGTTLDLLPEAPASPAIRIVAGRELRLGRSRTMSDLALRADDGDSVGKKTKALSRIHVTWCPQAGFLDGNGIKASANGSTYEGETLSVHQPRPAVPRGTLMLGRELTMTAIATPPPGPWPWLFEGEEATPSTRRIGAPPVGTLRFEPPIGRQLPREAVWVEREIGVIPVASGIVWTTDPCAPAVWFVFRDGFFYAANPSLTSEEVSIDGAPLAPGEMRRLRTGLPFSIGSLSWQVKLG